MDKLLIPTSAFTRMIASACAIFVFTIFLSTNSSGETTSEREAKKSEISQGIKKYRINIRRLQQGIQRQQEQVKQNRQQERNLLAELQDIDGRLLEQREKLDVLEDRMQAQQELITVKERELARSRQEKDTVQGHLQKRIKAYYKTGNIGFMNVAFSTKNLPELLQINDSFQTLIKYDRQVIDTYRHTIGELERSIQSFELEQGLLKDFISQNINEKEKLDLIKQEKEILLARIRTETKLHEQAIVEMKQASTSLSSHIQVLEKKGDLIDQSFLRNKGKMAPPINGKVVSQFEEEITNRLGISSISKGIAIAAPSGTIVKAIHEGEVIYSGYLRGYGNTIIVNHGYQYYSVTSRIERLLVKKGDKVNEQTEIGLMGDTATLMSEGLYIEIRHDSENLDPLLWLDISKLVLPETKAAQTTP